MMYFEQFCTEETLSTCPGNRDTCKQKIIRILTAANLNGFIILVQLKIFSLPQMDNLVVDLHDETY